VTIKTDHSLVRRGAYAVVRHHLFQILARGRWNRSHPRRIARPRRAAAAFVAVRLKSRTEERFMIEPFGIEYEANKCQLKALIRFVL
jgi:protein-S-isoprenylcysteine O-methyltransferase Ste14